MARALVKFPLMLGFLLGLAVADTFTIEHREINPEPEETPQVWACNFNENTKTYNVTDLLLCMDELARTVPLQQNANQNRISNRVYQDKLQSHPAYAFPPNYSIPSNGVAFSNHYAAKTILTLLSGGLQLSNLLNLFDFNRFTRPDFNLFAALSSIARYDDLKCIPRILCEVASGSMPGSLTYRQTSVFQDSGINTLLRLLTLFDISGTSPILSFGRAVVIGYTNRGKSHTCYQTYSRCPKNSNQLISYLNNYNGGFFRFFADHNGNYNRLPQSSYYTINRNSDIWNKNIQSDKRYVSLQTFLTPKADPTGTRKLTFDNENYHKNKENDNINIFSVKQRESGSNKIIFPKNKQDLSQLHRIAKLFDGFNDLNVNNSEKVYLQPELKVFPDEDDQRKINIGYYNKMYYNQQPNIQIFKNKRSNGYFSCNNFNKDSSTFTFPK